MRRYLKEKARYKKDKKIMNKILRIINDEQIFNFERNKIDE